MPIVEPGKTIRCVAWSFEAQPLDITYTGRATITMDNLGEQSEFSYDVSGEYDQVMFTEVQTQCDFIDDDDEIEEATAHSRVAKFSDIEVVGNSTMGARGIDAPARHPLPRRTF